ncbi:hypothetical protein [Streptomyces sp. NPDC005012]|uniref:hypothetical protein n=1 Tax=Streptomyces sp. NPDC005012 TaxID=3154558 RepID=UPI0033AE7016
MTATAVTPVVVFAAEEDREDGGTSFSFAVAPEAVAPGGRVTLSVDGCRHAAQVSSALFPTVTLPRGTTTARARVDADARPGTVHQVSFRCGLETGVTELNVRAARTGPTARPTRPAPVPERPDRPDASASSATPSPPPAATVSPAPPEHGSHAGDGGTVAGFDLGDLGLGALLVTGALGAAHRLTRPAASADKASGGEPRG